MKEITDEEFFQHATKVIVLSDTHTGAYESPKPQTYLREDEEAKKMPLGCNPMQLYANTKWNDMIYRHSDADIVLLLGDLVEGTDDKSKGHACWATTIKDQIDANVALLSFFNKAEFVGVQGSRYHTGMNPSWDQNVLESLKGKGFKTHFSKEDYGFYIEDVGFHLRHNIGYRKDKKYRGNPLGEELLAFELHEKDIGDYRVILRGHTHYYVYMGNADRYACIVPGWKGRDAFASHRTVDVPDCGYLVFYVLDDQYKHGGNIWKYPKEYLMNTGEYRKSKRINASSNARMR
jgi:predicted phosphodiesterase